MEEETMSQRAGGGGGRGGGRPPTPLAKMGGLSDETLKKWVHGQYKQKYGDDESYNQRVTTAEKILDERKESKERLSMDVSGLSRQQLYAIIDLAKNPAKFPKGRRLNDPKFYAERAAAADAELERRKAAGWKESVLARAAERKRKAAAFKDVYPALQKKEDGRQQPLLCKIQKSEKVLLPVARAAGAEPAEFGPPPAAAAVVVKPEVVVPPPPAEAKAPAVAPIPVAEVPALLLKTAEGKIYKRGALLSDSGGEKVAYLASSDGPKQVVWCQTRKTDDESLSNAESEFERMKELTHPNILRVLAFGTVEDPPRSGNKHGVVISEYQRHGTLEDYLRRSVRAGGKLLDTETIRQFMSDLIAATSFVFSKDIMHRDLKSANLLLSEDGRLLLADFGISERMAADDFASGVFGSPGYMAPDILRRRYRSISDIWSIGVLCMEMLTCRRPFAELLDMIKDLDAALDGFADLIGWGVFPDAMLDLVLDENDSFKGLSQVVRYCMAFSPECRYTIGDLAEHPLLKKFATIIVDDFDDSSEDKIALTLRMSKDAKPITFHFEAQRTELESYVEELILAKRDDGLLFNSAQKDELASVLECALKTANRNVELLREQRTPKVLEWASRRYTELLKFQREGIDFAGLDKNVQKGVWKSSPDGDHLFIDAEFVEFIIRIEKLKELHEECEALKKIKEGAAAEAPGKPS